MSSLEKRSAVSNLAVGCFVGTLATAASVAVIVSILVAALFIARPSTNWIAIGYVLVQSVSVIILAGLFGAVAGLLIAMIDHLAVGRLHDNRMPFWVWLPIGGVMGATGAVLILFFLLDTKDFGPFTAIFASIGELSGLIAGPVFGLFLRQRQKEEV